MREPIITKHELGCWLIYPSYEESQHIGIITKEFVESEDFNISGDYTHVGYKVKLGGEEVSFMFEDKHMLAALGEAKRYAIRLAMAINEETKEVK